MASTDTAPRGLRARPMAPHLQVYRMSITMVMSGAHRITGLCMYIGTLLLAWFLFSAAADAATFSWFSAFIHSWIGRFVLLGYTWSLLHHLLGGVRHMAMDMGYVLDQPNLDKFAWGVLYASLTATLVVWIIGYSVR